jgi:hypothetical protein
MGSFNSRKVLAPFRASGNGRKGSGAKFRCQHLCLRTGESLALKGLRLVALWQRVITRVYVLTGCRKAHDRGRRCAKWIGRECPMDRRSTLCCENQGRPIAAKTHTGSWGDPRDSQFFLVIVIVVRVSLPVLSFALLRRPRSTPVNLFYSEARNLPCRIQGQGL